MPNEEATKRKFPPRASAVLRGGVKTMTNHPNRKKPVTLTDKDRRNGVVGLRYDAYMAYLDGRVVRAKQLNGKAAKLEREAKETV